METVKPRWICERTPVHYFFMVNVYTCLRGNKISTKFKVESPDIEEYLDVTMHDAYDGVDAYETMLQRISEQ